MKISVKRFLHIKKTYEIFNYDLPDEKMTVLEALNYIKNHIDPTFSYQSSCRSGVCGACACTINEKEALACSTLASDKMNIEPLRKIAPLKDLIVDFEEPLKTLERIKIGANFGLTEEKNSFPQDEEKGEKKLNISKETNHIELQTSCILCACCYSVCPVFDANPMFIGPFSLTKAYRYIFDSREKNLQEKLESIQTNGIWDCTLCGACSIVCPQGIDSRSDILMLRNKSGMFGFYDPNFGSNFGFGLQF